MAAIVNRFQLRVDATGSSLPGPPVETGELLGHGGVYRDIVENKLLSFTFAWDRDNGEQDMLVTLTFEDAGRGKTKFTLRQERFNSVEERDGHDGGWNSAFDRLGDLLKTINA